MKPALLLITLLLLTTTLFAQNTKKDKTMRYWDFVDNSLDADISSPYYTHVEMQGNKLVLTPANRRNNHETEDILLTNVDTTSLKWEYQFTDNTQPSYWLLKIHSYKGKPLATNHVANGEVQKTDSVVLYLPPDLNVADMDRITHLFNKLVGAYQ